VFGGKITTYRKLAEHALEELAPFFPRMRRAWTQDARLPGGDIPGGDREAFRNGLAAAHPGVPANVLHGLAQRHGTRATRILDGARDAAGLGEDYGGGLTEREVAYLIEQEWARTADDVLWRRTKCGLAMTPAQHTRVAERMAGVTA
jgi:glycerol-3-phosphate dehydrogenase